MKELKKVKQGEKIYLLMKKMGLNQEQLARELKVCSSHISMYFSGQRKLSIDKGKKLASFFGVPLEDVYK